MRPNGPPADSPTAWFSVGLGPGQVGTSRGLGGRVGLTYGRDWYIYGLRLGHVSEAHFCLFCSVPKPDNSNFAVSILFGGKVRRSGVLATAAVGPAATWTTQRGNTPLPSESTWFETHYNAIERFTVGLTSETGVYLSSRGFAIGPTLWLDASWVQTSAAIMIDLQVGFLGSPEKR
jgi:hypothetical protein